MQPTLFSSGELEHLPLNCRLYRQPEEDSHTYPPPPVIKCIDSVYHQNNNMKLLGGFPKSISRRLLPYD
jgi:hypothetical protein